MTFEAKLGYVQPNYDGITWMVSRVDEVPEINPESLPLIALTFAGWVVTSWMGPEIEEDKLIIKNHTSDRNHFNFDYVNKFVAAKLAQMLRSIR